MEGQARRAAARAIRATVREGSRAGTIERAREALGPLGDLPIVCEQRDCSPWNIVIGSDGSPALLDWESAEPDGLPGLDLVYFLANSAFVLDGALDSGTTRESYAALLAPDSPHGRVAAESLATYAAAVGLDDEHPAAVCVCSAG